MTFGNLKKGDVALAVYELGGNRERVCRVIVKSVGPKWITADSHRFNTTTGYGEYGWQLHTEATLAEARNREALLREIGRYGFMWHGVSTDALSRIVEIVRAEKGQ